MPDSFPPWGQSLRQPPANLEAEQALLGALLANNKAYDRCIGLKAEHFADPAHALIFAAIQRRIETGALADPVTIRAEFEQNGAIDDAGGVKYLAELLGAMVGIINAGEYAAVIRDNWLRRQMIGIAEETANRCYGMEPELDARAIHAIADDALLALAEGQGSAGARDGGAVGAAVMDGVMTAMRRGGGLPGLTWGLRAMDRMTGGLRRGQFVLVAGRPSMGKTSFALRVALGAAEAGARVLFVSAEMLAEDVMARAIVARARLPLTAYTHGAVEGEDGRLRPLNDAEVAAMAEATRAIGALPVVWDDEATTIQAVRARARQMMRAKGGGLDLIVVDYLGRMRAGQNAQRFGLNAVVTELSAGFKDLAKQLGVPVVVLSQLSREVERREDKTPLLSDLRDSGSLEQDADVVVFLYRAHYYLIRGKPQKGAREKQDDYTQRCTDWEEALLRERGKAVAIVAKQRQGRTGPVRLRWDDDTAQFGDEPEGEE